MAQTHELKVWTEFWDDLDMGIKTFEVRKNDRDFKVGDTLVLKRYDPIKQEYTGRSTIRRIAYILHGGQFGIEQGYCILGITH